MDEPFADVPASARSHSPTSSPPSTRRGSTSHPQPSHDPALTTSTSSTPATHLHRTQPQPARTTSHDYSAHSHHAPDRAPTPRFHPDARIPHHQPHPAHHLVAALRRSVQIGRQHSGLHRRKQLPRVPHPRHHHDDGVVRRGMGGDLLHPGHGSRRHGSSSN